MQSSYAEQFERDMGCTEAEWLGWLPAALGDCAWQRNGSSVVVSVAPGQLRLHSHVQQRRLFGAADARESPARQGEWGILD